MTEEPETYVKYHGEWQEQGNLAWYVAGDIYGHDTYAEAVEAIEEKKAKVAGNRSYGKFTAARVTVVTTVAVTLPYELKGSSK